jgi:hypothetical protein
LLFQLPLPDATSWQAQYSMVAADAEADAAALTANTANMPNIINFTLLITNYLSHCVGFI